VLEISVLVLRISLYLDLPENGDLIAGTCNWVQTCIWIL